MQSNSMTINSIVFSLGRIAIGCLFAYSLYYAAEEFGQLECREIQIRLWSMGPVMMPMLLFTAFTLTLFCIPTSIIAIFAGIIAGPAMGAPIVSAGVVISSALMFSIGKLLFKNENLPLKIDQYLANRIWFNTMMEDRAPSSFHWCAKYSLLSPVPYPYFALLVGIKIPHLKPKGLITGVFVGSLLHIAGYTLAGAGIGCAIINHAIGLTTRPYSWLILISCVILILLSRFQNSLAHKEKSE